MSARGDEPYRRLRRESAWAGLVFGLVMGLGFGLALWGRDAYLLWQAQTAYPCLRLALGLALSLPPALLAGWLTGWSERAWVGGLSWLAAALAFNWIAAHVPFELSSWLLGHLEPDFAALTIYPLPEGIATRQGISSFAGLVLLAIAGSLQVLVIDSLRSQTNLLRRAFSFLLCLPLFVIAALFADELYHRPLRQPLLELHYLLELRQQTYGQALEPAFKRQARLGALDPLGDWVLRPRRLLLGDYDEPVLDTVRVLVDFDGNWARCWVIAEQPSFCQPSLEDYLERLACLRQRPDCTLRSAPAARQWLQGDDPAAEPVEPYILNQAGALTWLAFELRGQPVRCLFNEKPRPILESCTTNGNTNHTNETGNTNDANGTNNANENTNDTNALPRYDLWIELDPAQAAFRAGGVLTYTNTTSDTLSTLALRLYPNGGKSYGSGRIELTELWVNGVALTPQMEMDDSLVIVPLAQPLPPGAWAALQMSWNGQTPRNFGGGYGIYNLSDDFMALSGWFPILAVYENGGWRRDPVSAIGDSVYSQAAEFRVRVEAPAAYQVLSSADEQSPAEWVVSRDFFLAAGLGLKRSSRQVQGVRVNAYVLPGFENMSESALAVAVRALTVFHQHFGPYPYTELDVVQAPMQNAGGVEFPGIVLIEAGRYDGPREPAFTVTIAHEVAHQWWYALVGSDIFTEPWLDEALTTYSAALYYEWNDSPTGYDQSLASWQQSYRRIQEQGQDEAINGSLAHFEASGGAYGAVVYAKGALFFHELRQEIGDEAFFAALRRYAELHAHKLARSSNLLGLFEQSAGVELDEFYRNWSLQP